MIFELLYSNLQCWTVQVRIELSPIPDKVGEQEEMLQVWCPCKLKLAGLNFCCQMEKYLYGARKIWLVINLLGMFGLQNLSVLIVTTSKTFSSWLTMSQLLLSVPHKHWQSHWHNDKTDLINSILLEHLLLFRRHFYHR